MRSGLPTWILGRLARESPAAIGDEDHTENGRPTIFMVESEAEYRKDGISQRAGGGLYLMLAQADCRRWGKASPTYGC